MSFAKDLATHARKQLAEFIAYEIKQISDFNKFDEDFYKVDLSDEECSFLIYDTTTETMHDIEMKSILLFYDGTIALRSEFSDYELSDLFFEQLCEISDMLQNKFEYLVKNVG